MSIQARKKEEDEIDLTVYNREEKYKKSATYRNRKKDIQMEQEGRKLPAEEWRLKNKRKGKTKQEFLRAFLEKNKEDLMKLLKEVK